MTAPMEATMAGDTSVVRKIVGQSYGRAIADYFRTVDPRNPWPRGSDWWRKHNELYRRDFERKEIDHGR